MQEIDPKLVRRVLSRFRPEERTSLLDVVSQAERKEEIESWGLFCACLAWGGIEGKAKSLKKFYCEISRSFRSFIQDPEDEPLRKIYPDSPQILRELCKSISRIRDEYSSIREFASKEEDVESAIFHLAHKLRKNLDEISTGRTFNLPKVPPQPPKNPARVSALKRYCMYFRWMVRDEEPDFGIWDFFDKKDLFHPIDRHVARIIYRWRVLSNDKASWHNVKKATQFFRKVEPKDPIKYDYHLVTFGQGYCKKDNPDCKNCPVSRKFSCRVRP